MEHLTYLVVNLFADEFMVLGCIVVYRGLLKYQNGWLSVTKVSDKELSASLDHYFPCLSSDHLKISSERVKILLRCVSERSLNFSINVCFPDFSMFQAFSAAVELQIIIQPFSETIVGSV